MGQPKLSLPFGTERMLPRVARIVGEVVCPVVVVAANGQEIPPLPESVRIVRDEYEDLGPLAGIAAGLAALQNDVDAAYVTACDTPLLTPAFVSAIVARLGNSELAVVRNGRFHHPLAAVYRTSLLERVRGLVAASRLRPLFLIQESRSCEIDADELRAVDPNLDALRNTNTPEEYVEALRIAGLHE